MKTIISILILGLTVAGACAESEEVDAQFFHPAASMYIQGDITSASNLVAKGLSIHPDDGKLKRLKDLLENPPEQEEQGEDGQQGDEQQNPEEQEGDPQDNQNEQEQENQEPEENPPDQEASDEQENQQPPAEPEPAEAMTEDEAEQLLDAMRQEEMNKRLQLHPVMGAPVKVDKDW